MTIVRMIARLLFVLLLTAVAAHGAPAAEPPAGLTPQEIADGWISLFDGETLYGWKAASEVDWRVADGVISASAGDEGLLHTTSQFGNYVLKLEFRAAPETNSGVFLRTSPKPGPGDVATRTYELNIAPADNPFPTGSFVQRKRADGGQTTGQWQTLEATADGPRFQVSLDGREVLDYTDSKPLGRGYIGLQYRTGKIEFRNIKLKPLGMKSLFNGKDLTGWKTYPELPAKFTVTPEGWLHATGGRAPLESEARYADFTMQLEVFVNGKALNSGVFYRTMPGDPAMNGYEVQIQNGHLDGDRTKPQDCGTGGIFRRMNARRIVADDFTWFSMTIHADDKHVSTWVNGYQVCDWSDDRQANVNPRQGLRLEPGTLMLQAHDPTTDLSFRNLRLAELPER